MNQRHRPTRSTENATLQGALWTALVATLIVLVFVKFATGIVWTGAFGIALLTFCLTFGIALRTGRGVRRD
jgi:hypothetical protein